MTIVVVGRQHAILEGGLEGTDSLVWHAMGSAIWRSHAGETVGTVPPGTSGGWLVTDRRYQDLGVRFSFRCTGECQAGILLGMEQRAGRFGGLFISLTGDDLNAYVLTLDARGQELERRKLAPGAGMGAGAGAGGGRQGGVPPTAPVGHPMSAPRPSASVRGEWNHVEVRLFTPVNANSQALNVVLNGTTVNTGYPAPAIGPGFGQGDRIARRPSSERSVQWLCA